MKKIIQYTLLAGCALGVMALSTKLATAQSCCGGSAQTETVADKQAKPDLLTTCPVSGEKLGEMGKAFTFTYKDQEVKLCCKSCKKDFDKNPDKYIAIIRAADKK